jgi:hypothetical protein
VLSELIALLLAFGACFLAFTGNNLGMFAMAVAALIFSLLFCPWWE